MSERGPLAFGESQRSEMERWPGEPWCSDVLSRQGPPRKGDLEEAPRKPPSHVNNGRRETGRRNKEKGRKRKKAGREGQTGRAEGGEENRTFARFHMTEASTVGKTESHATV